MFGQRSNDEDQRLDDELADTEAGDDEDGWLEDELDDELESYEEESSGVSSWIWYIGILVVVNIILIAVDAPFYIY